MSANIGIQLVGALGDTYDLLGGIVRLTDAGLEGMGLPEFDDIVQTTAVADGQRFLGYRVKPRKVFLPFRFKGDAETDVDGAQAQWWRNNRIGATELLRVTKKSGEVRELALRIQDDGGYAPKGDPYLQTVDAYGVTYVADKPWWQGAPVPFDYSVGVGTQAVNFFGGGNPSGNDDQYGPPFVIAAASGSASQMIANAGDVPAWVRWTLKGSWSAFSLGVGGKYISSSMSAPEGSTLVIETDPTGQSAYLNGTKVSFFNFTSLGFAPIPTGSSVQLDISITGAAYVHAEIRPKFARAL